MNSNSDAEPFAWYIFLDVYLSLQILRFYTKTKEKKIKWFEYFFFWNLFFRGADFIDCYY